MKKKEELILFLNSNEESRRLYAVEDILDLGMVELSVELMNRLKVEKSPAVKNSIVSVLQKMEYTDSYPLIFNLFPNRDAFMRNSAVSIFGSYGENAVTFLSSYLDHSDKEVRKLILDSLVEIATKRNDVKGSVLDIFRACLYDPSINVIITAIEYLGRLGDKNSLEDLIQLFQRVEEPMLRSSVLDCILKIGQKEDFENTLSTLFQDLNSVDSLYLPQLMRLLAQSGKKEEFLRLAQNHQEFLNYSEDVLASIDWLVKKEGLSPNDCMPILMKVAAADSLDEDMRVICVTLLLASQDINAINFVKEWSKRGSKEFQAFCIESMEKDKNG